jgi:hypothetical protein
MAELKCARARVELSARLDDEIDEATAAALDRHITSCADCRAHGELLAGARRALRAQPAQSVPNLAPAILARVASEPRRSHRRERLRVGGIAAAAAALLVAGASLPFSDAPPDVAGAREIRREVRRAARGLETYRASFELTERGWHPNVPVRRFRAEVAFDAPEDFMLRVRDQTRYPAGDGWPTNDVDVIANARRWWIREPSSCPTAALPGCAVLGPEREQRRVVDRQPFDGTSALPTDIIIPLETLSSSSELEVEGRARILGRSVLKVALPYRQAVPLVGAIETGGSWREFQPFDRVIIWIDRETWFPLRFDVVREGRRLLSARATSFARPPGLDDALFRSPPTGLSKDGGFDRVPFGRLDALAPSYVAGLDPYRAGIIEHQREVLAFADGMMWLKISSEPSRLRRAIFQNKAEELALAGGGYAYYEPGSSSFKRRVDLYGPRRHVHLESNLPRAELLAVAASLDIRGRRTDLWGTGGLRLRRLDVSAPLPDEFALAPGYLPPGYRASSAFESASGTVTVYYRRAEAEFDGIGIRVTQSRKVSLLPPTSENTVGVRIGSESGRWAVERGELEWIDHGVYRAVAAPSFGLATAVRIARSLR